MPYDHRQLHERMPYGKYAVEYMEEIVGQNAHLFDLQPETIVKGRGHHKSTEQSIYEKLAEYTEKLKKYAKHITICKEDRNSYSKTDKFLFFKQLKAHSKPQVCYVLSILSALYYKEMANTKFIFL